MTRKFERKIVNILGWWQIIDGLITIIFFSSSQKVSFMGSFDPSTGYGKALGSLSDTIYIFIVIFGSLLIGLGLFNLVLAKKYMKDEHVEKKIGIYLLSQTIFSYFILDIPGVLLSALAGITFLAKNKSIRLGINAGK